MIGNTLNYDVNSSITSTCDILTESSARLELENDQIVKSAIYIGPVPEVFIKQI